MGFADIVRIALGRLTPEEQAERDAAARQRRLYRQQRRQTTHRQQDAPRRHRQRVVTAAGIHVLELVCHPDMWLFAKRWAAARRSHPNPDTWWQGNGESDPTTPGPQDDMVTVRLSGPQVAELLTGMDWARIARFSIGLPFGLRPDEATRATAARLYRALADQVDRVDPANPAGPPLRVVLDDRPSNPPPTTDR